MDSRNQILLILRAQSGDKDAYNQLLLSIQNELYGYIYNMINDKSNVDDILQEVFVIIYRKLFLLREPECFRTWVYKITTREIFRVIRKKQSLKEKLTQQEDFDNLVPYAETFNLSELVIEKLNLMINDLTPASRAVLTLHYNNGIPINEIADILDIAAGTVKSRLAYGLNALRKKVNTDKILKEELGF